MRILTEIWLIEVFSSLNAGEKECHGPIVDSFKNSIGDSVEKGLRNIQRIALQFIGLARNVPGLGRMMRESKWLVVALR